MRIDNDIKLDFKDVLLRPKRSTLTSRKTVSLEREYTFRNSQRNYCGVPIIAANMDGVGTRRMAVELSNFNMFTCLVKHYAGEELVEFFHDASIIDQEVQDHTAMSVGISEDDLEKLQFVNNHCSKLKYVCVDVANGYTERFIDVVKHIRDNYPLLTIIAGNVVTGDITEELILAGADIVKVGIGPGSVCTTRIKTGVGYPQLSAVIECADAAHGLGGHIIADGGCTSPGDVAKAFAAGADFVMLGGMLAGHDEGGGDIVTKYLSTGEWSYDRDWDTYKPITEEKKFVKFYGMSSKAANDKHFGGLKDYRSSEGREVLVPYKGKASDTVRDILGGLRSACTYVGASKLKYLSKCTTFVRVTQQYNNVFERNTI
jgi:GMP reductase